MGTKAKMALATGFVGAAALAATAFGQVATSAQEGDGTGAPQAPRLPRVQQQLDRNPNRDGCADAARRPGARRLARRLVHSESKVQLGEGFGVVTVDVGEITALNDVSKTVTIKRADGESVSATAQDGTKICRNGKPATFADLEVGDRAGIVQGDANGEHKVRRIGAHSKDSGENAGA
jgi:hypothetical protein